MAVSTFKQQCPSCEAMISIKETMIGKKVECTKCKDKFIAERPEDDEVEEVSAKKDTQTAAKKTTAVTSKAPAAGKRPKVEIEEDEDEVDEKPSKGKAKPSKKDDDEDEKDAKKPKADKTGGKSNKLVIGLGLAVVGVLLLALAAFFVMPKTNPPNPPKGGGFKPIIPVEGDKDKDNKTPTPPIEETKPTEKAVPLTDTEAARLTNLLPPESEHVLHVNFKDLFGVNSTLREAAFMTPAALEPLAAVPMLGFSLLAIDDLIVAEKYTTPGWKYTVIHFSDVLVEEKLRKALQLEPIKVAGQVCYKTARGKTNPYFDTLAKFSFGVPNHLRFHEARRNKETFFRIHNAQTLIVGDEAPVKAFMAAKEKFPQQPKAKAAWNAPAGDDLAAHGPIYVGFEIAAQANEPKKDAKDKDDPKEKDKVEPKDPVDPKLPPGSRDDIYLTIKRDLKAIMDRMENRGPDNKNKVLLSSATDMKANLVETRIPNVVARRPRQFWDVTVLLYEPAPRLLTLGTSIVQRDTLKYQFRNELTCIDDPDPAKEKDGPAKAFEADLIANTSFKLTKFLREQLNHEIRMPAPGPKDGPGEKMRPEATSSQIAVYRQSNTVDFVMDLVLDDPSLTRIATVATLTASELRGELEASMSPSLRHDLANGVKLLGQKGLTAREIPAGRLPPGAFNRDYDSKEKKIPLATDREPKNRISWMAALLPHMGHENLFKKIQFNQSWRDSGNWSAGHTVVPQFLDPMYPDYTRQVAIGDLPLDFAATHYVGVAGVGRAAAYYKRDDPRRGVFSYDGSASLAEIQGEDGRGISNTIMIIQVPHDPISGEGVSPWIAGGGATVRGVPEKNSIAPFVLTTDRNNKIITHDNKRGTFVVMADGSVRFIDQNISDEVFKAMCTIRGSAPKNFDPAKDPITPLIPAPKAKEKEPTKKPAETPTAEPEQKAEPKTSRWTPAPPARPTMIAAIGGGADISVCQCQRQTGMSAPPFASGNRCASPVAF